MKTPAEILDTEIMPAARQLKKAIDKYPHAFSLSYLKYGGYCLNVDLDCLEP